VRAGRTLIKSDKEADTIKGQYPRKVAVVTDTTACLLPEQVKEYDIEVVPVALIFKIKSTGTG